MSETLVQAYDKLIDDGVAIFTNLSPAQQADFAWRTIAEIIKRTKQIEADARKHANRMEMRAWVSSRPALPQKHRGISADNYLG